MTVQYDKDDKPEVPKGRLFSLGRVVATPGAIRQMAHFDVDPLDLLYRHITGDWGECDPEDADANVAAVLARTRVLSVYRLDLPTDSTADLPQVEHKFAAPPPGSVVWCITEADRSVTTLLLPSEY